MDLNPTGACLSGQPDRGEQGPAGAGGGAAGGCQGRPGTFKPPFFMLLCVLNPLSLHYYVYLNPCDM
jgi:hypothetical protein